MDDPDYDPVLLAAFVLIETSAFVVNKGGSVVVDMFFVAVVFVIALGFGRILLSATHVDLCSMLEETVFSIGLGVGGLAYLILGVGLQGWLTPSAATWLAVGLFLVALPGLVRLWKGARGKKWGLELHQIDWSNFFYTALLLVLVLHAIGNLVSALAPPTAADALRYHIAVPKLWIRHGRISYIPSLINSARVRPRF